MNKRHRILLSTSLIILVMLACTISIGGTQPQAPAAPTLSQQDLVNTAVAQTVAANQPTQPPAQPPVVATTQAPPPPGPTSPPPPTPLPCNWAKLVWENYADGTDVNVNANFTKTWRLLNAGTCTWNTNYKAIFHSGNNMNGPATKNFTHNVNPGETIDLSMAMKAPASPGSYKGTWHLYGDDNSDFTTAHGIWVAIDAVDPVLLLPDLKVTAFSINPPTPKMGVACTVTITVKNNGGTNAGPFMLRWYGLSTFANSSCAWAFPGLAAGASQTESCNYTFASWYPINKTSIVYVDHGNQVAELNEGNNTATISPFGVNP